MEGPQGNTLPTVSALGLWDPTRPSIRLGIRSSDYSACRLPSRIANMAKALLQIAEVGIWGSGRLSPIPQYLWLRENRVAQPPRAGVLLLASPEGRTRI
jgi:hypothetical protein